MQSHEWYVENVANLRCPSVLIRLEIGSPEEAPRKTRAIT